MVRNRSAICLILLVMCLHPSFTQEQSDTDMQKEQDVRNVSMYGGGVLGLGIGILTVFGGAILPDSEPLFKDGTDALTMWLAGTPCNVVQTLSGGLATRLFAETFLALKINKWLSFPAGMLLVPYLLWVGYAAILNGSIYYLNQ